MDLVGSTGGIDDTHAIAVIATSGQVAGNLDTEDFNTDNNGDTWFVGLRFGWTFLSLWDKKQQDKI